MCFLRKRRRRASFQTLWSSLDIIKMKYVHLWLIQKNVSARCEINTTQSNIISRHCKFMYKIKYILPKCPNYARILHNVREIEKRYANKLNCLIRNGKTKKNRLRDEHVNKQWTMFSLKLAVLRSNHKSLQ